MASVRPGPFRDFYQAALVEGIKPTMARLTLAPKLAASVINLTAARLCLLPSILQFAGTITLRICPAPTGGGPKPQLET